MKAAGFQQKIKWIIIQNHSRTIKNSSMEYFTNKGMGKQMKDLQDQGVNIWRFPHVHTNLRGEIQMVKY